MVTKFKNFIGILLLASVAGFTGAGVYNSIDLKDELKTGRKHVQENLPARTVNYMPVQPDGTPVGFVDASERSVPAVVHVKTTYGTSAYNGQGYNPFRDFFWGDGGFQNPAPAMSAGSGVIISDDGYIVTNNHVVTNAEKVDITLNDKRSFTAKVIGTDPSTDLALLKVDEDGLPFIPFGNSDAVKVGEWVLAVGNPFNLTSTVTAGIVSAKGRNIHILPDQQFPIESFIQTDAAVNPGNSGGALVSTSGNLIGINTAIASNTGAYTGYSFAIPVNIVKKVVDDLLEYGNVQRGFIGVSIRDIDSKLVQEKGINTMKGVYVAGLTEDGAAASAGIKEGDIITKVAGNTVNTSPELQEQVSRFRPGDKVDVTLVRSGDEKVVSVTLRNKNGNTGIVKNEMVSLLGAEFEAISVEEGSKLGIQNGVKISKLNAGKLRSAGIREGFIIESIDNKTVSGTDDIISALKNKTGGVLIEGIYPNGMRAYYGFGL